MIRFVGFLIAALLANPAAWGQNVFGQAPTVINLGSGLSNTLGSHGTPATSGNTIYQQMLPTGPQTGTTYTLLTSDVGNLAVFTGTSAAAWTVPAAGSAGFENGNPLTIQNAGTAPITLFSTSTLFGPMIIAPGGSVGLTADTNTLAAPYSWNIGGNSASPLQMSLANTHIMVGNVSNKAADVALSGDATMANTGAITVTKTGGAAFGALATANSVTAAQMLALATGDVYQGNGSNQPAAVTLSAAIDAALGSAQGDVLYRSGAAWSVLAPGTSGTFLKTQGAGANPVWDTPSSGGVTWPTNGDVVISNGTSTPAGVAPSGTNCLVSSSGIWIAGSCSGSSGVTSVGLSLPAIFTVTNSPVTSTGTLTGTLANETANTVFAGPSSGGAAAPTFRALVLADQVSPVTTTTLTASGTFTIPARATLVRFIAAAQGGCGGGGGGLSSPFTGAGGGGGGGGQPKDTNWFPASLLTGTATVTIGTPCTGGTAGAAAGNGSNGNAGADVTIAITGMDPLVSYGGGGGAGSLGGAGSTAIAGGGGAGQYADGGNASGSSPGSGGSRNGTAGSTSTTQVPNASVGGSSGGGASTTGAGAGLGNLAVSGSTGGGAGAECISSGEDSGGSGRSPGNLTSTTGGVTAGSAGGTGAPMAGVGNLIGGGGGGGGASGKVAHGGGGKGGDGGLSGGGGGGGGAGCDLGATGGAGGTGGAAQAIMMTM